MKGFEDKKNSLVATVILSLVFCADLIIASPEEADQAEEKARASFVEHFTTFVQDKNVMGRAQTPDGKPTNGGPNKTQFNKDDGQSYKSDLTYHDFSYTTNDDAFEQKQGKNNQGAGQGGQNGGGQKSRSLLPFVSNHGGLSEAGGSSALERKMYELHDKFSKENEDPAKQKKADEEKGIKYRSTFKIETREVFKDPSQQAAGGAAGGGAAGGAGGAGAGAGKKDDEPEKVERIFLREEAKPEVAKVGEESYQTIDRAAKDKGNENDPQTLANSALLREAAGRATESWWNSTLANLNQRRVNKGMPSGGLGGRPELNEDTPTCDAWAQKAIQEQLQAVAKQGGGQQAAQNAAQDIQKQIQEAKQKCEQLTKLSYNVVNPKFEAKQGGKGEELKTGDQDKEDPYSRDLRNQLEVLKSAGKDVSKLKGNWKYGEEEGKQEITVGFDEDGNPSQKEMWTVKDQMDSYNEQLEGAAKGFKEVKERFPQLQIEEQEILKFKMEPEEETAMKINGLTPIIKEDFGVKEDPNKATDNTPENYDELLEQAKGPASR